MPRPITLNAAGRALLLVGPVLPALAVTVLTPVLPAIQQHFSDVENAGPLVRALVSSLSLAMIVGALVAGFLADRLGMRRVMVAALLIFGIAGTAGVALTTLPQLLASRVLVGLTASVAGTLIFALVAAGFEGPARDRWMGWTAAAGTIGSLIVVPAAGLIGNFGWRYVFLLHLLAAVTIVLAVVGIRTSKAPVPAELPEDAPVISKPRGGLPAQVWVLIALCALGGAVINAVPMFLPFHLAYNGYGTPSSIAFAMLSAALVGAIVCLLYGAVRRKLSNAMIFAVGFAVGGVALILVSQSSAYAMIVTALVINGLGLGITMPNMNAAAAAISPPARQGTVIGLANSAFFAGAPLAQVSLDLAASDKPPAVSIMLLGGLGCVLCISWLALSRWMAPVEVQPAP